MTDLICKIKDCGRKAKCQHYCITHYKRYLARTDMNAPIFIGGRRPKNTSLCHCGKPVTAKKMCTNHYNQDYQIRKDAELVERLAR